MFTIRDEQMETFQEVGERRFEERMVAHIAEHFPEEHGRMLAAGGPAAVTQFVQASMDRAEKYKIRTERGIAGLMNLDLAYGVGFELRPEMEEAKEVLEDYEIDEMVRIDLIIEAMPDDLEDPYESFD